MRTWFGYIQNAVHVKIEVVQVPFNGFELTARWKTGQEYKKHYSEQYVRTNRKKPCAHAMDFMRELLQHRGIA